VVFEELEIAGVTVGPAGNRPHAKNVSPANVRQSEWGS